MKTQKGITLVALIITIVVLLILAVVSINSIQNEGIMSQAQNAAGMWNASQANEQGTLGGYEETINKYIPNSNANVKKISFTIYITEETTYYAEEGMTWEEWVESEYNVDGFIISGTYVKNADASKKIYNDSYSVVETTAEIAEGTHYVLASSSPVPH